MLSLHRRSQWSTLPMHIGWTVTVVLRLAVRYNLVGCSGWMVAGRLILVGTCPVECVGLRTSSTTGSRLSIAFRLPLPQYRWPSFWSCRAFVALWRRWPSFWSCRRRLRFVLSSAGPRSSPPAPIRSPILEDCLLCSLFPWAVLSFWLITCQTEGLVHS